MSSRQTTDFLAEIRDQPMDEPILDEPSTLTAQVFQIQRAVDQRLRRILLTRLTCSNHIWIQNSRT